MPVLEPYWLAEIHREVYVAILKSWLPHGQRGEFAKKAGLRREYLSFLCSLNRSAVTWRLPSPAMAEKIAAALPAPAEVKISLVENMALAHVNRVQARYLVRAHLAQRQLGVLLAELEQAHQQAIFGAEAAPAARAYRTVRDAAADLLWRLSPETYPAAYAQACLYLHDAQCVLDRADDALRCAKLARLVLENSDFFEAEFAREQVENLKINAIRGEAVAYHNLGLYREVPRLCEQAQATWAYRNAEDFWKPIVRRDRLNTLAVTPRFSIREARQLARDLVDACARRGDGFALFLGQESWLRCLIQHAEWKQAQRVLQEVVNLLPHLPRLGPLHRALLLKTQARFAWQQHDLTTWRQTIHAFVQLARQSGLKHQWREVRRFYGLALQSVLDDLGWQG